MATAKQEAYFKETILGNARSKQEAALNAGYSLESSRNVKDVIESRLGFKELLEKYLPDDKLADVHKQALEATDKDSNPEWSARLKALDMGYKLKGSYAPEKIDNKVMLESQHKAVLDALETDAGQ